MGYISLLLFAFIVPCLSTHDSVKPQPKVFIPTQGEVHGNLVQAYSGAPVYEFLGIPYATPPVGDLRFKAPKPHQGWLHPRDATSFGSFCMQPSGDFTDYKPPYIFSEDCLTLNVFTPANAQDLPVYVYFHGGSLLRGSSARLDINGVNQAGNLEYPIIVVTVNYRLGVFGFLTSTSLQSEVGNNGNLGFLDQRLALEWVQKYISAFGGNPDKVTIGGHSAGGVSVGFHLLSKKSWHLYQQAILQSGPLFFETNPDTAEVLKQGDDFTAAVGCKRTSHAAEVKCLLGTPAEKIVAIAPSADDSYAIHVDGLEITDHPYVLLKDGLFNRVPLLYGVTSNEASASTYSYYPQPIPEPYYRAALYPAFHEVTDMLMSLYPCTNPADCRGDANELLSDIFFVCPSSLYGLSWSTFGIPVYSYRFSVLPDWLPEELKFLGAYHGSELPFVFNNLAMYGGVPEQQHVADIVTKWWASFIATGKPQNVGTNPVWGTYNPALANRIDIVDQTLMQTSTGWKQAECASLHQIFEVIFPSLITPASVPRTRINVFSHELKSNLAIVPAPASQVEGENLTIDGNTAQGVLSCKGKADQGQTIKVYADEKDENPKSCSSQH